MSNSIAQHSSVVSFYQPGQALSEEDSRHELNLVHQSPGNLAYEKSGEKSIGFTGRMGAFFSRGELQKQANKGTIDVATEDIRTKYGDVVADKFAADFSSKKYFGSPLTKGAVVRFLAKMEKTGMLKEVNETSSLSSPSKAALKRQAAAYYGKAAQVEKYLKGVEDSMPPTNHYGNNGTMYSPFPDLSRTLNKAKDFYQKAGEAIEQGSEVKAGFWSKGATVSWKAGMAFEDSMKAGKAASEAGKSFKQEQRSMASSNDRSAEPKPVNFRTLQNDHEQARDAYKRSAMKYEEAVSHYERAAVFSDSHEKIEGDSVQVSQQKAEALETRAEEIAEAAQGAIIHARYVSEGIL